MAPLGVLDSLEVAVTLAPLGLRDLVRSAPSVTKDKQAFLGALGPPACQVRRVKQDRSSPCLALREQKACQAPPASKAPKVTGASLEPQDGQDFREKRVPWASLGSDFQGLPAPRVWTASLETGDFLGAQAAQGSMAYLAAPVCQDKRGSLESACQDSRGFLGFLAFLAHLGRRGALEVLASLESTEPSGPLGFRASEVTQDLRACKAPWALRELQE